MLVIYSALCPSLCVAAAYHTAAAHTCCADDAPPQQTPDTPHTDCACNGHAHVVTIDAIAAQGAASATPVIAVTSADALALPRHTNTAAIARVGHAPPFAAEPRPLYMLHRTFRI